MRKAAIQVNKMARILQIYICAIYKSTFLQDYSSILAKLLKLSSPIIRTVSDQFPIAVVPRELEHTVRWAPLVLLAGQSPPGLSLV